jgi:hypothetical protein
VKPIEHHSWSKSAKLLANNHNEWDRRLLSSQ